jgi:glucose 1-dehydrogenase
MRVLVTGAASGIGRATCLRLARDARARGAAAGIAALDLPGAAGLDAVVDELRGLGATALPVHADLGDPEAPAHAIAEAVGGLRGLDGLVSNAGINRPGKLVEATVADWDRVFAVNTRATWLLARAAYPALRASHGAIVAVASMSGSEPHANLAAYGPSKAAVIMLAQVLAQELAPDGIRVNTVSPGMTRTGMTARVYEDAEVARARDALVPLGRVATPEDMAAVIAFLLGPDAAYVTGQDLIVDGGLTGTFLGRLPGLTRITRS